MNFQIFEMSVNFCSHALPWFLFYFIFSLLEVAQLQCCGRCQNFHGQLKKTAVNYPEFPRVFSILQACQRYIRSLTNRFPSSELNNVLSLWTFVQRCLMFTFVDRAGLGKQWAVKNLSCFPTSTHQFETAALGTDNFLSQQVNNSDLKINSTYPPSRGNREGFFLY